MADPRQSTVRPPKLFWTSPPLELAPAPFDKEISKYSNKAGNHVSELNHSESYVGEIPVRFKLCSMRATHSLMIIQRRRVRFHIIRYARIENVGKYQSRMVSK